MVAEGDCCYEEVVGQVETFKEEEDAKSAMEDVKWPVDGGGNDSEETTTTTMETTATAQLKIATKRGKREGMEGKSVADWSHDDVAAFIVGKGLPASCAATFVEEQIDGRALLLLTRNDVMSHLGLKIGVALKAFRHIQSLQRQARRS